MSNKKFSTLQVLSEKYESKAIKKGYFHKKDE